MDKKYFSIVANRTARARSKRLQGQAVGTANSTVVVGAQVVESVAGGGGATSDGHTHENKQYLDQITTDKDGYLHLTQ